MWEIIYHFVMEDPIGLLINLAFGAFLLPTLFDAQKPPLFTSISTGVLLIALAANGSYRAIAPAVMAGLVGMLWLVVAFQRWRQR